MALSIAIGYIMHKLTEMQKRQRISLATSVELIIQAQQAVMAATIAAMVASTSSNSSKIDCIRTDQIRIIKTIDNITVEHKKDFIPIGNEFFFRVY